MKIVNRAILLSLPAGTVFCKFDADKLFGQIEIKKETIEPNDFFTTGPLVNCILHHGSDEWSDLVDAMELSGLDVPMDFNSVRRDGLYNDAQLFAVFGHEDILKLIKALNSGLERLKEVYKEDKDETTWS